jgi:TetR/AcrR family transcriptional repressor of nem operon
VLDTAMGVFWRLGYADTSLETLLNETGLAKQSLYDTFGDKRALYLKAMARYRDKTQSSMRKLLAESRPVKSGFTKMLYGICAESREEHERGCLLLSANMEREADDKEIERFLRNNQTAVEKIFTDALQRAKVQGELSGRRDPAAMARFLLVTIQGMRAMARHHPGKKALQEVADVALATLE